MRPGQSCVPRRPRARVRVPSAGNLERHRRRRLCSSARTGRHPVRGWHRRRLRPVVRPVLGQGEADHAARARESRVPNARRRGVLRLLREGRRRPREGLLQLRPRPLAPDRAELELLGHRRLRREVARRRSGSAQTSPRVGRGARSRTGTTPASHPAGTGTTARIRRSGGRWSTRVPTSSSSGTTTTTSASRRRTRADGSTSSAECASSWSEPGGRASAGSSARGRTARRAMRRASVSSS